MSRPNIEIRAASAYESPLIRIGFGTPSGLLGHSTHGFFGNHDRTAARKKLFEDLLREKGYTGALGQTIVCSYAELETRGASAADSLTQYIPRAGALVVVGLGDQKLDPEAMEAVGVAMYESLHRSATEGKFGTHNMQGGVAVRIILEHRVIVAAANAEEAVRVGAIKQTSALRSMILGLVKSALAPCDPTLFVRSKKGTETRLKFYFSISGLEFRNREGLEKEIAPEIVREFSE